MEKKNIVVIGGGTGTHTILRGLKRYQKQVNLSAIVTMADSGGSTGRLRDEFGYLPVGDVRMALAALASDKDGHEELLRELFLYRFDKGNGLSGHNFGNLLLVALTDILGSEEEAIRAAARVLRVQGSVIPVTTEKVNLVATYQDGVTTIGEHIIDEPERSRHSYRITSLSVTPSSTINPRAEEVLLDADLIVLGPGDLYTSVLANCVIDGVADAIRHSTAKVVYVSNLMTKVGQTTGMGVAEHLVEVARYIGTYPDYVLINTTPLPKELLKRYEEDGEYPVSFNLEADVTTIIPADLLAGEVITTAAGDVLRRSLIRHDSRKLARKVMDILSQSQVLS
jgi:uncharacterized cofD-like protein